MRDLGVQWQRYQMMPLSARNWQYQLRAFIDSELYKNDSILPEIKKDFKIFSQGFTIGNVPATYLEITVLKREVKIPPNAKVRLEVRIVGGEHGNTDWIPWGTYFVDTRDVQSRTITLKCYDRMLFGDQDFWNAYAVRYEDTSAPTLREGITKEQILNTILYALDTELDPRTNKIHLPDTVKIPHDATVREVLGWVGMSNGMNWVVTDNDELRGVVLENFDIASGMEQNDTLLLMTFSDNPQVFAVKPSQFSVDELNDSIVEVMEAAACSIDYPTGAVRIISSDAVQYKALVQIYGDSKTTNIEDEAPHANYWIAGDESQTPVLELSNPLIPSKKAPGEALVEHAFSRISDYKYRGIVADTVIVDPAVEFGDSIVLGEYVFEIANISWFGMLAANIESPLDGNVQSEFPFKAPASKQFQRVMDAISGTKVLLEVTDERIRGEINEITQEGGTIDTKLEIKSGEITTSVFSDDRFTSLSSQVTQTADDITSKVSKTDLDTKLVSYSTRTQTAQSIKQTVDASFSNPITVSNTNNQSTWIKSQLYYNSSNNLYYYWDDSDWITTTQANFGTVFEQTATGFKFKGNVKIDGSLISSDISTEQWGSNAGYMTMNQQNFAFWQSEIGQDLLKMYMGFLERNGVNTPLIVMGAGDLDHNDIAYMVKEQGKFKIFYKDTNGAVSFIEFNTEGLSLNGMPIPVLDQNNPIEMSYVQNANEWNEKLASFIKENNVYKIPKDTLGKDAKDDIDEGVTARSYFDENGNLKMAALSSITWGGTGLPSPVKAMYSVTGTGTPSTHESNWHNAFDSANDKYMIISIDGGNTWGNVVKVVGDKGANGTNGTTPSNATQQAVFNWLTNNGALQGLFEYDNGLYINAEYIAGDTLQGITIKTEDVSESNNKKQITIGKNDGICQYNQWGYKRIQIGNDNIGGKIQFWEGATGEERAVISELGGEFRIYPGTNAIMHLGTSGKETRCYGNWNFNNASVTGVTATFG